MTTELSYCGGGCGRRIPSKESGEPEWFCCFRRERHANLNPFFCPACWGKVGNCGPGPQDCGDLGKAVSRVESPARGERVSVECPDCDEWVVLAPNDAVDHGTAIGRRAAVEHYGTDPLGTLRALYGVCPKCEAVIGLVITRRKSAPPAEA